MTTTQRRYFWQVFQDNADALVWTWPTITRDNEQLRMVVGDLRRDWAMVPPDDGDAFIRMIHAERRSTLSGTLAFISGVTRR